MATARIVVDIPARSGSQYDVRVGKGLLARTGEYLRAASDASRALIISDSNVAPLYLPTLKASLAKAAFSTCDITVEAGESAKSLAVAEEIWSAMAELKLGRDALIVALGGGVVGDLAGFIASTYGRGLSFAQVPTSLLAMVDASVGGKTAINLPQGKNLVGTFTQPIAVIAASETLATLSDREWACGCAEIAKSALIDSDDFFFWLLDNAAALAARDMTVAEEAITRSVVFKANVVAEDESESRGLRECLNYGHTLGHAIEKCAGFGTFSHGEAVAEGMRFAARLGAACVDTPIELVQAQDELLDALGLPALAWTADPDVLLDAMLGDKKVRDGELRFVLPRDVGIWELVEADREAVREQLASWMQSKEVDE